MRKIKLDKIDRQILHYLQEDGRMSNVDLAKKVNISAPPCLRRVKALEDSGYIKGYHADINAQALDYNMTIFAQISLEHHSDKDLSAFTDMVQDWEMVRECHLMTGDFDVLLKVVAKDWDEYQHFITEKVTKADNVGNVRSHLSVRTAKQEPGVPIDTESNDKR